MSSSSVSYQATTTRGADAARQAEQQLADLAKALDVLRKSKLSDSTKQQLMGLSMGLDQLQAKRVLDRALDELDAVPRNRVDTDPIKVPHGVVVLFRVAANEDERGAQRSEYKKLIDRFLKNHRGIEIGAADMPWGNGDAFSITGSKAARLAFQQDPKWPKLQKALEDIYLAEHLPGYPSDRPKRQIHDTMKYVFGR